MEVYPLSGAEARWLFGFTNQMIVSYDLNRLTTHR